MKRRRDIIASTAMMHTTSQQMESDDILEKLAITAQENLAGGDIFLRSYPHTWAAWPVLKISMSGPCSAAYLFCVCVFDKPVCDSSMFQIFTVFQLVLVWVLLCGKVDSGMYFSV